MLNQIHYVKIPESPALSNFTNRKLDLLRRRYDTIQNLHVHFKLENTRQGNAKVCAIECTTPGFRIHASATREYFEHALKTAMNELIKQLEKRKAVLQIV